MKASALLQGNAFVQMKPLLHSSTFHLHANSVLGHEKKIYGKLGVVIDE